jgi:hypothetical protein
MRPRVRRPEAIRINGLAVVRRFRPTRSHPRAEQRGSKTTTEKCNQPTPPNVMHPIDCTPKTPVSTPLHLPHSTRLDEISLAPAGHIGEGFGPFGAPGSPRGPLQASHFAHFFLQVPLRGTAAAVYPQTAPLRPLLPPAPLPRKRAAPPPCLVCP